MPVEDDLSKIPNLDPAMAKRLQDQTRKVYQNKVKAIDDLLKRNLPAWVLDGINNNKNGKESSLLAGILEGLGYRLVFKVMGKRLNEDSMPVIIEQIILYLGDELLDGFIFEIIITGGR